MNMSHVVSGAVLSWLLDERRGIVSADPLDGSFALTYGRSYRGTVALFFIVATALLVACVPPFLGDPPRLALVGGLFGLLWLGMVYAVYDAFFVTLHASERGLGLRPRLGAARNLPWERIASVDYVALGNWYTFRSADGGRIRISIYRNGLTSLKGLVVAHIGRSPARTMPTSFYSHVG